MSKVERFIEACKENLGEWTCSMHTTESNQPAAIFREAKKRGYHFEEIAPGRWGKSLFCPRCNQDTTHYKMLDAEPSHTKGRFSIPIKMRAKVISLFDERDAFTGARISTSPEIDHKTPWIRLSQDIDISEMTDQEIRDNFQLLSRQHNLLKDRACRKCVQTNRRPGFLEIPYWYQGGEEYLGSCVGCGWYDGKQWRQKLSELLKRIEPESDENRQR